MYRYHLLIGIYLLVCGAIFGFLHSFVNADRQKLAFLKNNQPVQQISQLTANTTVLLHGTVSANNPILTPLQPAGMVVGCYQQYDSEDGWELEETYEQPLKLQIGKQEVVLPDMDPCPEGSVAHSLDARFRLLGLKVDQELLVIATVISNQPLQLDVAAAFSGNKDRFMASTKDSIFWMQIFAGFGLSVALVMFGIHFYKVRNKIKQEFAMQQGSSAPNGMYG